MKKKRKKRSLFNCSVSFKDILRLIISLNLFQSCWKFPVAMATGISCHSFYYLKLSNKVFSSNKSRGSQLDCITFVIITISFLGTSLSQVSKHLVDWQTQELYCFLCKISFTFCFTYLCTRDSELLLQNKFIYRY